MERSEHTEITTENPYANTRFLKFMLNLFSRNITFLRCLSWIKSWLLYNICFCRAALFTSGLVFSYKLAEKVIVSVFITYFTDYSITYDLRQAAAFTNFQEGLSASLVLFMIYISEAFSDHLMMIIFCLIVTYTSGMAIFALTASDVSLLQSIIGLTLVAVGRAGLMPFIRGFTIGQLIAHEPVQQHIDLDRVIARENKWWRVAWGVGSLVAIPLFNSSWITRFVITALVMALAFVVFMMGKDYYHKRESSAITTTATPFATIRVVKAALLKWHIEYPSSPDHFFTKDENDIPDTTELWPQVRWLRWIDKAAVIESTLQQNQQIREGRLLSVREVQETKYILKMVPMWCAFPVFGLALSSGNTFFAEQAIGLKFSDGLEEFTNDDDHLSLSMKMFLSAINGFVINGIGSALNILFVYPNKTFFSTTLNLSRLDLYYKYLTFCGPTLNCAFLLMISIYIYRCSSLATQANPQSQSQTIVADSA